MRVPAALQLAVLTTTALSTAAQEVSYGVDVSFPIHHRVSTNYDFLPHNTNSSVAVPAEFQEMPVQPLGDRQAAYVAHVDACRKNYGSKSNLCDVYEYDRILMNQRQVRQLFDVVCLSPASFLTMSLFLSRSILVRQPQSMQVREMTWFLRKNVILLRHFSH